MDLNKNELYSLIDAWAAFREESSENSLEDFALWVLAKKDEQPERNQMTRDTCYLLSRAERYHKAQVKSLFEGLPLLGYEDFLLLNTVYHRPNISKKELYEANIYEMNTGTPTVNRLKREKLLVDTQSKKDKRVYLLNITEEGKKVRNEAFSRFEKTLPQKFFSLADEELVQFNHTLKRVEQQFGKMFNQDLEKK